MFTVSSCSCLSPIQWSHVLSREWRCSWSSADRWCSNYIWVIDNFIAYQGVTYIRDLTAGLGSIPFFQFNSNSNSVIFNSNSNSTTHKKFQFQFQFQFQRFQFQFQFRRFQIPAISIEFWKWPLVPSLKLIIIILTRYMYIKLLLLIPSVSYPLLNGYNYMASWLMLYQ